MSDARSGQLLATCFDRTSADFRFNCGVESRAQRLSDRCVPSAQLATIRARLAHLRLFGHQRNADESDPVL